MSHDVMANTLISNSYRTSVSNMNHEKPRVGVLNVPYITKAPIHDTIERKKLENPRIIYPLGENREIKKQKRRTNLFMALELGAFCVGVGFLIKGISKIIKKIKH
ncbi:hypothetical protein IKA92_04935 [bacterium]|nr:hypothetical protein [bacterium]